MDAVPARSGRMVPTETLSQLAWAAFLVYWWLASKGASAAVAHEPRVVSLSHLALFAAAFAFAVWPFLSLGYGTPAAPWPGLAVQLAGLAFAVWARVALGEHWSGTVTVKEGHELVQHGPYAVVRHPIYLGLLVAFLGTALLVGDARGWIALACAAAAVAIKVPVEERFMARTFPDAWARYRERVKAILPFVL